MSNGHRSRLPGDEDGSSSSSDATTKQPGSPYSFARMVKDAPTPWRIEKSPDGLHALVDANGDFVARSPMYGWLEDIATCVNEKAESL